MALQINLPQDRASQIAFALALYPMFGQPRPKTCDKCGGIQDGGQSKTRRCLCREWPDVVANARSQEIRAKEVGHDKTR